MTAAAKCHYCESTEDLRPYGPGGSMVCFPCGTSPERDDESKAAFGALLDAAGAVGGGVVTIGQGDGPRPGFNP